jgi:hypothetical protein
MQIAKVSVDGVQTPCAEIKLVAPQAVWKGDLTLTSILACK